MKIILAIALLGGSAYACPHQDAAQKTAQKSDDKKAEPAKKDAAKQPSETAKAKQPEPAKKPS